MSRSSSMRPQPNPLDLNNFPDDYNRDGKLAVFEDGSSSSGYSKRKNGGRDGKDECEKVYECRFCSLKFCKSQALGGHMNRHRQERETETLNKARQLVYGHDSNLAPQPLLAGCHPSYHQGPGGGIGNRPLSLRSVYPPTLLSGSSSSMMPPPQPTQPYLYPLQSRLGLTSSYHSEYYVGHALGSGNSTSQYPNQKRTYVDRQDPNYTCLGAPIGHGLRTGSLMSSQGDVLNRW